MHVLESVIIAAIMVSAVAYVAMFDVPPPASKSPRDVLQQKADDALGILHDTPMVSELGDNALSVYLLQCMQGTCDNLTTRLDNLLPAGAEYAVYISNGQKTFPVYVTREPTGEAVTSTRLFEPKWSSTFIEPALSFVNGSSDPLMVYSFPMFNSNPISQGGSPLLILVHGNTTDDHADYVLTSFASTVARNATDPTAHAVSLFFVDDTQQPIASIDVVDQTIDATVNLLGEVQLEPSGDEVTFRLRLAETANISVPEGVQLDVHMPRGWTAWANETLQNGTWNVIANATDASASYNGSYVRAQLARPVQNESVDFVFNATYTGDKPSYYAFRAQLSRGAQSTSELLVKADNRTISLATPIVTASVPRPLGGGAPTVWTLSIYAPVDDPQDTANASVAGGTIARMIDVDRIQIVEQNGARIFGGVYGLDNASGSWINGGDRLTWDGKFRLSKGVPMNLTFLVNASGVAGAPPDASPFVAPVVFDAWSGRLATQAAPGLYRGVFLPANSDYDGYNASGSEVTSTELSVDHAIGGDAIYRTTLIPGSANYSVGHVSSLSDALYGSYVSVENRNVPVGGELILNANVQSTLFALAKAGQEAGVTLRFYPPWSGDLREPIYEKTNLDQGLLTGDISAMVLLDMNDDGYPDPVIGTTNGRVLAVHALTGDRLAGDVWSAPLTQQAQNLKLTAAITQLTTITLRGETYIVVGTDENSDGVFVIDRDLDTVWSSPVLTGTVTSLDTTVAIDPYDSEPDIVVGLTSNDDGLLYVLRALEGQASLQTYSPADLAGVFYVAPGAPEALLSVRNIGPAGATPGVAATVQTLVDGPLQLYINEESPEATSPKVVPASTPRAGLAAVNQNGSMTSTLFGTPVTLARAYNYDGDGVTDILAAGPAGYVLMLNGTALTQPLYSYLWPASPSIIDADTRSSVESYVLTADGAVTYTDDAWITAYSATFEAPILGAVAIDSRATNDIWAVGAASSIWRSVDSLLPATLDKKNFLQGVRMDLIPPTALVAKKMGASYDFSMKLSDFKDIWFEGSEGWVVGSRCTSCNEILVMNTSDGGQTWTIATRDDGSLTNRTGGPVRDLPTRIQFFNDVGWITAENGTLLRSLDGRNWAAIETGVTATLRDISCNPEDPLHCAAVGDNSTVLVIYNATVADPANVEVAQMKISLTQTLSDPPEQIEAQFEENLRDSLQRHFYSIGIVNTSRAYIGSSNMVLATFDASRSWTTLPMNYLENNATVINVNPDGTGYVYGGGPANGRVWFLHDYGTEATAMTKSLKAELPAGAVVTSTWVMRSNISTDLNKVMVDVATNGDNWKSMGEVVPPPDTNPLAYLLDSRNFSVNGVSFDEATSGGDFRVRVNLTTPGDRTLSAPHVRELTFLVNHTLGQSVVSLDFTTLDDVDADNTTATWDTELRELRTPYVREAWVRNLSGEVLGIRTGFDINNDTMPDVWAGTGDVLASNSPDYIIYAGTDENKVVKADNRVYLLDGRYGTPLAKTASLNGSVTHLRLSDVNGDGKPEQLFATTYDVNKGARLHALDPATLTELWSRGLSHEEPQALEVGLAAPGYASTIVVTDSAHLQNAGHLWAQNSTTGKHLWRTMPEDMGRYHFNVAIPENWLFGSYVVEVEVEWEASVTNTGSSETVIRSARFYDYFIATPHDALSPPSPVYNVHLLTWFPDWG